MIREKLASLVFALAASAGALPVYAESGWDQLNMTRGVTHISREIYSLHMRIFWICVLGGMTSFPGMLAGAMLIGIVESITATFYGPSWAPAVAFGFLLLTLAVRPAGILWR